MSGRRMSPSHRWAREHGGTGRQRRKGYTGKVIHRTFLAACAHSVSLFLSGRHGRLPYRCRWGPHYRDGETFKVHWHVGRRHR